MKIYRMKISSRKRRGRRCSRRRVGKEKKTEEVQREVKDQEVQEEKGMKRGGADTGVAGETEGRQAERGKG